MQRYNPKDIEPKWQKYWDEHKTYQADLGSDKPKYMAMSMFNYPSGAGIHIGHAMNYTISDVKARFMRQLGHESYHPIGWDAFGLPAENYAIKAGVSPQASMAKIIPDYHVQYKAMGWSNDWSKEISTHTPDYYKWTQWIFSQMYKQGLAYQDSRMQWWCEQDRTVLANEQIIDGKCWRHDSPDDPLVQQKEVKQWFFKITEYADELLEAIDDLDWTESVKLAQKNWIGRSQGAEISFALSVAQHDYVLLHSFTGTPNGDFHPWVASQLENSGSKVTIPELPNTDQPDAKEQAAFVLSSMDMNEETVLVGHSYGSVSALRVVEQLKHPISKLVLVAGFAEPGFLDKQRNFEATTDWQFDFDKIKANVKEIVVLRASNDSAVPKERADFLSQKLNAKIVDFTAESDHVTGIVEPVVLENIMSSIKVFTTRPDTLYGATFLVLAPEHELVAQLTTANQQTAISGYIKQAQNKSEVERQASKDKTGVFTGAYATNPVNDQQIPIWIADYVLTGYGTGAIMAVPAHDERDHEFALKYQLPIVRVVSNSAADDECTHDEGVMTNSGQYDTQPSEQVRETIVQALQEQGVASAKTNYKMRDWSVSRQRYWGAPIPIVYCPDCGTVPIPDDQLPVVLPELTDFAPAGDGRSALARATDWLKVQCPTCGKDAERETDTLDTYICSSWYMYRYMDPHNDQQIFDSNVINKWAPVDFYNGGDHATAHLLYARFIARFFTRLGIVNNPEPFEQMLFNGKVTAQDGTMFSKSKGNGVDPLEIINQGYGADALRTYLMFAAPLDLWMRWDPQGVPGTHRFLSRVWTLVQEYLAADTGDLDETYVKSLRLTTHSMIKKMTEDIRENHYNTAIAAAMGAVNDMYKLKATKLVKHAEWQAALEATVACIAPFAPHISDELWHQLGHDNTVQADSWPQHNESYLQTDQITIVVQINGKLRAQIQLPADVNEATAVAAAQADIKIQDYLSGNQPKKIIYISGKLVNLVV